MYSRKTIAERMNTRNNEANKPESTEARANITEVPDPFMMNDEKLSMEENTSGLPQWTPVSSVLPENKRKEFKVNNNKTNEESLNSVKINIKSDLLNGQKNICQACKSIQVLLDIYNISHLDQDIVTCAKDV